MRYKTPLGELIESPSNFFLNSQNLLLREKRLRELKERSRLEKETANKDSADLDTLENAEVQTLELSSGNL